MATPTLFRHTHQPLAVDDTERHLVIATQAEGLGVCIQDFDTRWNQVLLSTSEVPNDKILESLNKLRI